jgi:hypothetical protein
VRTTAAAAAATAATAPTARELATVAAGPGGHTARGARCSARCEGVAVLPCVRLGGRVGALTAGCNLCFSHQPRGTRTHTTAGARLQGEPVWRHGLLPAPPHLHGARQGRRRAHARHPHEVRWPAAAPRAAARSPAVRCCVAATCAARQPRAPRPPAHRHPPPPPHTHKTHTRNPPPTHTHTHTPPPRPQVLPAVRRDAGARRV